MSRHMLQLEAALLQGKAHLPLAHIYVNGAKKFSQQMDAINASGASVNEILLPGSVSELDESSSDASPTQTVPKSPASPPQTTGSSSQTNGKATSKPAETSSKLTNGTASKPTSGTSSATTNGDEKVVISGKVESIPDSAFEEGRKSAEELAKQFPNYNVGTPSKVSNSLLFFCFFFLLCFCLCTRPRNTYLLILIRDLLITCHSYNCPTLVSLWISTRNPSHLSCY